MKKILKSLLWGYAISRIVRIALTTGQSMEPTIHSGQLLLIDRLSRPKTGEIVAFKARRQKGPRQLVKRVVAVAGDQIRFQYGRLYVNDEWVKEPYLKEPMRGGKTENQEVPAGHVYVLGDNRNNSLDSRILGPIPLKDVIGVVWYARKN